MFNPNELMAQTLRIVKMSPEERFNELVNFRIKAFTEDISPADEIEIMMLLHNGDMTLENIDLKDVIKTRDAVETEAIIRISDGDKTLEKELFALVAEARDPEMENKILTAMEGEIKEGKEKCVD